MEEIQARSHSSMEALEIISLSDSDSELPSLEAPANGTSLDAAPCPVQHHPLSLPPSLDHLDDALHPAPTPNPSALNGLASDAITSISTTSTTSSCDPPGPQPQQQQQQPTTNADPPPPAAERTPSPLPPLERGEAGAGAAAAAAGLANSDSESANEAPLMASPPASPLDLVSPSLPQGNPSPFDADDLVDSDADELDGEAAELLLQQEVCSNRPTGLAAHLSQATENFGATLTNATNAFFGPLPTETQYQQKRTHSLLRTDLDDGPDADSEIQQSGDEAEAGEGGATGGADGGALLASWVQSRAAAVRNTLESLAQEPERAGRREQERSNGRGILDGDGSDSSPGASSEETEEETGEDGAAGGAEDEGEDDAGYGWWGMPVPSWKPPRVVMPNLDAITTIVSGGSQALGESMSRGVDRLEELANQSADKIGEAQAKVNEKASSFFREVVSDWKEGLAQANATANRMMDLSSIQDEIEQKRQKESAGATSPKQGEEAAGSGGPLPASSLAEYSPESGSGSDAPGESPLAHGAPPCQPEPAELPKGMAECQA